MLNNVEEFDSPTGKGVTGKVDGKNCAARHSRVPRIAASLPFTRMAALAEALRADGATVINIAVDGKLAGLLAIADPVKASTPAALKALAADGIKVIMLTGDNRTTAQCVARQLGIADVEADVLPEQKSAVVARLQDEGRVVAMAGDGVNDAPALAGRRCRHRHGHRHRRCDGERRHHAARGRPRRYRPRPPPVGGDHAQYPAEPVLRLHLQCRRHSDRGRQFSIRRFGLLLSPIMAAAAMALSSVSVVGNALRLRFTHL